MKNSYNRCRESAWVVGFLLVISGLEMVALNALIAIFDGNDERLFYALFYYVVYGGIYNLYWMATRNNAIIAMNEEAQLPRGWQVILLDLMTCGVFRPIWFYKMWKEVAKIGKVDGIKTKGKIIFCVVSYIFQCLLIFGISSQEILSALFVFNPGLWSIVSGSRAIAIGMNKVYSFYMEHLFFWYGLGCLCVSLIGVWRYIWLQGDINKLIDLSNKENEKGDLGNETQ